MTTAPVMASPRYPGISPKAYEHPADRAATAALHSIPVLDTVIKKISELRYERAMTQRLLGNAVRLGPGQVPGLWTSWVDCLDSLDVPGRPPLYAIQRPDSNATTFGSSKPVVMIWSGLVGQLDSEEIRAVLAHEAGHVLSEHSYYMSVLMILQRLARAPLSIVGELPVRALLLVLLEWFRAAELSCDRASALVLGDPMVTCRSLMRMAGGNLPGMSVDAFIAQATEYESSDDLLSKPSRFMSEIASTHPFPVRRVNELTRWVREGDFDRIRAGSYVRRGQEPPPSEELKGAAKHYQERFVAIIDSVSGGVQKLSNQVGDWLRGQGGRFRGGGGRAGGASGGGGSSAGEGGRAEGGPGPGR
ncbi:MAG: M48 family metallopeptidase, partial [Acidimicrobiales bacterium]